MLGGKGTIKKRHSVKL